jgi:hypothetical protein
MVLTLWCDKIFKLKTPFSYFQMELLIQAHLTRESFALSPALVKDYRHMLELAPRLLEELVKVLDLISFSLNYGPLTVESYMSVSIHYLVYPMVIRLLTFISNTSPYRLLCSYCVILLCLIPNYVCPRSVYSSTATVNLLYEPMFMLAIWSS